MEVKFLPFALPDIGEEESVQRDRYCPSCAHDLHMGALVDLCLHPLWLFNIRRSLH